MQRIGYFKINNLMFEIKVLGDLKPSWDINVPETATYVTDSFLLLSITNLIDNSKVSEYKVDEHIIYTVGRSYRYNNYYNISWNVALQSTFNRFSDTYTGVYTKYYLDGQIEEKYYLLNGLKEGPYIKYNRKNQIVLDCNYTNGKLQGEHNTYSDGKLEIKCHYKSDKLHGKYYAYNYETGDITLECDYIDGNLYKEIDD
jgi:antitoxin component YwqK of YwqJK toxin-antitoxin module